MNLFEPLAYAIEGFETAGKRGGELWTVCGSFFATAIFSGLCTSYTRASTPQDLQQCFEVPIDVGTVGFEFGHLTAGV
jgi:hypothetical protein